MKFTGWLLQNKTTSALGVFVIACGIRLFGLSHNDIALDEPFSIWLSRHSPAGIFAICLQGNNMPLFEWLMHVWIKATGYDNSFFRRLPSALFAASAATVWYVLSLRFASPLNSLAVAFLLLFSVPLQFYAHEFRCYSLFYLLCALQTGVTWICLSEQTSRRFLFAGGLLNLLLATTHYLAFFVLLTQMLLLVAYKKKESIHLLAFLFLPLFFCASPFLGNLMENVVGTGMGSWVPSLTPRIISGSVLYYFNGWIPLALMVLAVAAAFIASSEKKLPVLSIVLLAYAAIPLAGLLMFSLKSPLFTARYIGVGMIPLLVFFATHLPVKGKTAWLTLASCLWFLAVFQPAPWSTRSPKNTVACIKKVRKEKECVVVYPVYRDLEFAWHWDVNSFQYPESIHPFMNRRGIYIVSNTYEMSAVVNNKKEFLLCLCDVEGDVRKHEVYKELSGLYALKVEGYFPNTSYVIRAKALAQD